MLSLIGLVRTPIYALREILQTFTSRLADARHHQERLIGHMEALRFHLLGDPPFSEASLRRILTSYFQYYGLGLSTEPFPAGCKKLKGPNKRFRLRIAGDYRVVYSLFKEERRIVIELAGHRKDAYRWL